jgi:CDP-diacylglycerol--serine O-phosphatidyltransferase
LLPVEVIVLNKLRDVFIREDGSPRRYSPSRIYLNRDGSRRRIRNRRGRGWRPRMPKPIRLLIAPADIVTLMNFLCGIMAIMYSIQGGAAVRWSLVFILLGVIFDGIDGPIARKFGSSHNFGRWLDSIADATTFCIAPAFILYNMFFVKGGGALDVVQSFEAVLGAFAITILGILRLARFSLTGFRFPDFVGLPTPGLAILTVSFCGLYYWSIRVGWIESSWLSIIGILVPLVIIIGSLAMIADLRYKRFRGRTQIIAGIMIVALLTLFAAGTLDEGFGLLGSIIASFVAAAYLLSPLTAGPDYMWGAAKRMEEEFDVSSLDPDDDPDIDGGMLD